MSEESLEQPSPLKNVPSVTTGGTSLPLPTHELTREQVEFILGCLTMACVAGQLPKDALEAVMPVFDTDAALRAKLTQVEQERDFLTQVFDRHRGREKAMAEIVFQHIKHGDEKHQAWLREALVEALCRENTKACITFDELRTQLTAAQAEVERLKEEIEVWEYGARGFP